MQHQPEKALEYFTKWRKRPSPLNINYLYGLHRVGWAYWQNGNEKEARYYFNELINYCNKVLKMERVSTFLVRAYYDLAATYAFMGEKEKALDNLRIYNQESKVEYLDMMLQFRYDPLFDGIRNEPEFQQIFRDQEAKYQAEHERVEKWLEEQGMLDN